VLSPAAKQMILHVIRHTSVTHLLRAGMDVNSIWAWHWHVSLATTNVYAEMDLETKAQALDHCGVGDAEAGIPWGNDPGLMAFLRSL
jgi:site-specific recombinase XerD